MMKGNGDMTDPQTSAANANIPVNPLDSNPQDRLSADQVSTMVEWAKEDLVSGKITQAQADAQFAENVA